MKADGKQMKATTFVEVPYTHMILYHTIHGYEIQARRGKVAGTEEEAGNPMTMTYR